MKIKNFRPMECPVCHQYYFADDTDLEKQDSNYRGKQNDYCMHCGWKYDLYQFEHPEVENMTNKLSLIEYKKWFHDKIIEDKNYDFTDDNYKMTPHLCPVCGKFKFKDINSYEICPYCGWEDDELMENEPDQWAGCSNPLSLNDYRIEYQKKINEIPNYKWKNKK